ncbi:MAG: glycerol-3-phosphate dehydrogenase/oxidase [Candidatus Obscuribacter sp.]|jgi:glycerol-3-phosphate dehydrogenase|nr:glycerol-3-phosphate dehydrogenase/oxidase [Candidatus Obscuribacter sp.]MBK9621336.1 glycerol-3-phosphate dehydrogenase/oxidase [Candidatus Obscuribacter sp.]MBK9770786.1 glycerol-3-phosphate dehydrogenase/oxidase [Candidatus Obscuribacter sp.]
MKRAEMLDRVCARSTPWDMVIIGGGATGVGLAVDAASRGYEVLLLEQCDFGKGTSSRSTKLIHGGVRYLEQGNLPLVMEALHERDLLRQNAPHLVHDLSFIVPTYAWWEAPFYGIGLTVYDLLAGKAGFGKSHILPRAKVVERIPTIKSEGLKSGVLYHDGQFDDTRLLINLVTTAVNKGACVLNYASVTALDKDAGGKVSGVKFIDSESGNVHAVQAKVVINATGAFTDSIRRLTNAQATPMIAPSQGVHLVFDRALMPGNTAIMVPHTSDGRVMFVIPWHDHVLVGTTDTAIPKPELEPKPLAEEIEFILETASRYLSRPPLMQDVLSVFVGVRPLVKAGTGSTKALSRDHTIDVDDAGLLTVCGGKWTTYRRMAKDGVDKAITLAGLAPVACQTEHLKIHGGPDAAVGSGELASYGSDAALIKAMMLEDQKLAAALHAKLPYRAAEVVWAVRHEMCRTVEDFLARRVRALFLNAQAAIDMAPQVARLMADELGLDERWQNEQVRTFSALASQYVVQKSAALVSQS